MNQIENRDDKSLKVDKVSVLLFYVTSKEFHHKPCSINWIKYFSNFKASLNDFPLFPHQPSHSVLSSDGIMDLWSHLFLISIIYRSFDHHFLQFSFYIFVHFTTVCFLFSILYESYML